MANLGNLIVSGTARFLNEIKGKIDWSNILNKPTIPTVTDTYSATGTDATSGKAVAAALGTLDGTISGTAGAGKTLTAFSQTDGKVSATFNNISITKSQVSDFPTLGTAAAKDVPSSGNASTTQVVMGNDTRLTDARTPASHTHGNIQNGGTLQTTDVAIANGDKLVITDSSDSSKVARSSVTFDGSTTNKALTPKGTFESFTNNEGTITSVATEPGTPDQASTITTSGDVSITIPTKTSHLINDTKGIYRCVTDDASTSTGFIVTLDPLNIGSTLYDGMTLIIKNTKVASASGCKLSFNGGAAKPIWLSQSNSACTTHWGKNQTYMFVYDATNDRWELQQGRDTDANSVGYEIRDYYNNFVAGANKIFPYTIIMQCADERWESIVTSSSTGTSKTRNTHGFKLGKIALMYANATYNENGTVGNANIWHAYNSGLVDHRYSFNTANNATDGTTAKKPIYLVGSINDTDGLFYLDTTWWTQTLPSTADGKLYIYLGDAHDYYRMSFVIHNPIYKFVDGKIQEYAQSSSYAEKAGDISGSTGLTSSQVTTALGYTPYDSTNPNGYTSNTGTITGITMNGSSKGTSGVVDLGTVITDVSGKADKSATVSTVTYDTTNKKITKTINGTTTDVVTASTLKTDMALNNVGNFKAVSTVASQGLTDTEKSNARANIGAGTSSLTLGTSSTTALKGDTKYAGASTAGGAATSAAKLTNTSKIGDTDKPVYFTANGVPTAINYTIKTSVPSGAVFTDANVTQTNTTTDANYEILFSGTADSNTLTEGAGKNSGLLFNPNKTALTVGTRAYSNNIGSHSVCFGAANMASGAYSAAEGYATTASGASAHSEGENSIASGDSSHAEGSYTIANHRSQHVFGKYNIADPSSDAATECGNYVEIIGNGTATDARSNARTLDWDGNEWLAGLLKWETSVDGDVDDTVGLHWKQTGYGNKFSISPGFSHDTSVDTYNYNVLRVKWATGGVNTNPTLKNLISMYPSGLLKIAQNWTNLTVDTSSNNGITETSNIYWGTEFADNNAWWVGQCKAIAYPSGDTAARLMARNKKANGEVVSNGIYAGVTKAGDCTYSVTDQSAFRTAIGISNAITNLSKDVSSVASGTTFGSLYNFTMAAGTYILTVTVVWASNATGRRCAGLSSNTTTTNQGYHMVDNQAAVNGAKTFCHMTQAITVSSSTTYYVVGYQNSGSALGAEVRVNYIKLI